MGVRVRQWKGAWWVFVDYKGRRKTKRVGPLKRDAEAVASKIREAISEEEFHLPKAGPAFAEFAEQWLRTVPELRSIRPNTLASYEHFVRHHFIPFFGARRVSEITAGTIEDFIRLKLSPEGSFRHRGKPLSKSSLSVGLVVLRMILQRAVREKLLPANPMAEVEYRRAKQDPSESIDPFTGPELRRILSFAAQINADFATMLRLWAQTGMRAGESAPFSGRTST